MLKSYRHQNSIPPNSFFHKFLQDMQHILLLSLFEPHQKLFILCNLAYRDMRIWKTLMQNVGNGWATDFNKISLPACDRFLWFQPFSFLKGDSLKKPNIYLLLLSVRDIA